MMHLKLMLLSFALISPSLGFANTEDTKSSDSNFNAAHETEAGHPFKTGEGGCHCSSIPFDKNLLTTRNYPNKPRKRNKNTKRVY